jgi:hypothetical protein
VEQRTLSPRDLLLANKWSSLLFTTYSLSLSFLEAVAVSAVARSFRSFTVLADLEGYRSSLADAGAIGIGRNYDVVPIKVLPGGVFHPKIAIMADEDATVRATVGSGNLTFGGWGYNTEVVDVLVPGADSNCFADLAGFFEALAEAAAAGRLDAERLPDTGRFVETCRRASRTPGAAIRGCSIRLRCRSMCSLALWRGNSAAQRL